MSRFSWHSLPLILIILLLCIAKCIAQEAAHRAQQAILHDNEHTTESTDQLNEQIASEEKSENVREALRLLREIRPPVVSKLAKYAQKPKGVLGSTVYYTKEAFTLLFLTSPIKTTPALTTSTSSAPLKLPSPLAGAVSLLEEDANQHNSSDALFLLAEMNFHGNFTHPISYKRAFDYYKQLADVTGNSTAQYMLGFMYATGLNPEVGQDSAKSMLYHEFAARQHDTRSQMTLAYRHHVGISTAQDCEQALLYYQQVADKAIEYYLSGPPGGHSLMRDAFRIADTLGGVYGEGASFSSAGQNARQGGAMADVYGEVDDVLEYLLFQSSKGDLKATFSLARLYYDGGRGVKRNYKTAKDYFLKIARQFWTTEGKLEKNAPAGYEKLAAKAAGYIGRIFLRGEGTEQSFAKARIWSQRGSINGDALSQYSLGLIYRFGLGVDVNIVKAADYFGAAADQEMAVAQTHLGILFLDQGDVATASKYFDLAARNSHIEAYYYLAELNNEGIGRQRNCHAATAYYKIVAEKAESIWSSLEEANQAHDDGDRQKALVGYLMAAEMGSENAQANVAWLLDETKPRWSLLTWLADSVRPQAVIANASRLALRYWTRSARQGNLDSIVKTGDYYLAGLGIVDPDSMPLAENAASCYQAAAETSQSAQAMWNLGWMHENGIGGVKQDFHLAKRFYDQALETNKEAYLPVKLSLLKLRWRSWWNKITFGKVKSIQEEVKPKQQRTFMEWFAEFLAADARQNHEDYQNAQQSEADDWDHAGHDAAAGEGEYWDSDELYDDDIVITLIICGLIGVLFWLFWYRQQQQRAIEQRRRQAVQHGNEPAVPPPPPPAEDRGMFPERGDPAWNQWVAGAVGL